MNIQECMEFINSFSKSGKPVKDLSRAKDLMKRIGNPEKSLKFVHIAGTNGKGSTVEYISNALIFSGYRVGQFTSPFILHYNDRIRINGGEIDDKSLCEIAETVREKIESPDYSQFEITMAIAFLWFVREKCDIVVLECGIGGLLDCTNVIPPPLLSVITSISLDHTAILGDTVEKIATQKAGIIKKGSAVVVARSNSGSVKRIISDTARKTGSEYMTASYFSSSSADNWFYYYYIDYKGEKCNLAMIGEHQCDNAATAITACHYLREKCNFYISDDSIKKSLRNTALKGRLQRIRGEHEVFVDGGHNPDGVRVLVDFIGHLYDQVILILGMTDSKDYKNSVKQIVGYADEIYTVDDFAPNAVPAEKLAEVVKDNGGVWVFPCSSLAEAVDKAYESAGKYCKIFVCGSLYLASEYLNNYQK